MKRSPPSDKAAAEERAREAERKALQLCNLAGTMMLACKRLRSLQDMHAEESGANICFCEACQIPLPDLSDATIDSLVNESNAQATALDAVKKWRKADAELSTADDTEYDMLRSERLVCEEIWLRDALRAATDKLLEG